MSGEPLDLVVTNGQVQLQKCSLYTHECGMVDSHHVVPESWWLKAGLPVASPLEILCPNCQPPGTVVTTPDGDTPIENVRAGDRVTSYHRQRAVFIQSSLVTEAGSRPFHGDLIAVKVAGRLTRYTPEHRCVVQAWDAFAGRHVVYLMSRGTQYRIGRATGAHSQRLGFAGRAYHERADAVWVLAVCEDASEAAWTEAMLAWEYGIPQMVFRQDRDDRPLNQRSIDRFWARVGDNRPQAASALAAAGKNVNYPLWTAGGGRARNLGRTTAVKIEACNLETGMRMIPYDGSCSAVIPQAARLPITVNRERYSGPVYSMTVEGTHTYVADGLTTGNCHYNTHVAIDSLLKGLDVSLLPPRCVRMAEAGIDGAKAAGLTPAPTL